MFLVYFQNLSHETIFFLLKNKCISSQNYILTAFYILLLSNSADMHILNGFKQCERVALFKK